MNAVPYYVVTVGGIGEQHTEEPSGMLKYVTDHLDPMKFICRQFNWQNSYGPVPVWNSAAYEDNMAAAANRLAAHLISLSIEQGHRVVPMGYSGGAHVLSTALEMLQRAGTPIDIPAAVMLSNPVRNQWDNTLIAAPPGRYGVAGQHGLFPAGIDVIDLGNPKDVICSCPPPPHPVRAFGDLTRHFSLADPVRWGQQLLSHAEQGRWQNGWMLSSLPSWFDAVALARGYLFDGQHTTWYIPRAIHAASALKRTLEI